MNPELPEGLLDDLRTHVRLEVRAGFTDAAEISDYAVAVVKPEGGAPEALGAYAKRFTAEAIGQLQEEAKGWPDVTDCDRLDAAFSALQAAGILSRQNFSCCQPCGHSEILDEIDAAVAAGQAVRGYVFYHWQDTESAVDGSDLFLAYGAGAEGEEAEVQIGREIVDCLRAHGLSVSWTGSVQKRIGVALTWQRRRT